jgi:S-adenosylmethionine synthetase
VDRSAAYAARHAAKNIVAAGLADACEIQLAYAIGVAKPVSVMVDTRGTGKIADEKIAALVREKVDLRPEAIIERLGFARPSIPRPRLTAIRPAGPGPSLGAADLAL